MAVIALWGTGQKQAADANPFKQILYSIDDLAELPVFRRHISAKLLQLVLHMGGL